MQLFKSAIAILQLEGYISATAYLELFKEILLGNCERICNSAITTVFQQQSTTSSQELFDKLIFETQQSLFVTSFNLILDPEPNPDPIIFINPDLASFKQTVLDSNRCDESCRSTKYNFEGPQLQLLPKLLLDYTSAIDSYEYVCNITELLTKIVNAHL